MKAWVDFFGDAAGEYIELFSDVFGRVRAGGYSLSDWVEDGTAYWDRLVRDWAKAWSYGLDLPRSDPDRLRPSLAVDGRESRHGGDPLRPAVAPVLGVRARLGRSGRRHPERVR